MSQPTITEIIRRLETRPWNPRDDAMLLYTLVGRLQSQAENGSRSAYAHLLWLYEETTPKPTETTAVPHGREHPPTRIE